MCPRASWIEDINPQIRREKRYYADTLALSNTLILNKKRGRERRGGKSLLSGKRKVSGVTIGGHQTY